MINLPFILFFLAWIIPAIITIANMLISHFAKKRWLNIISPLLFLAIGMFLFFKTILSLTSESGFIEKVQRFFQNDWSMVFYLIFIPMVLSPLLTLLIGEIMKRFIFIRKHNKGDLK